MTPPATPAPDGLPQAVPARLDPAEFDQGVDHLTVTLHEGVAIACLNLPERRNCMDLAMTAAWTRLLAAVTSDAAVRVLVVTGAGTAFSSGGDTSWIGADAHVGADAMRDRMLDYYRSWLAVRDVPKPVIAAINGPAVGAGAALALACDIRWASTAAMMSFPFVHLAIHPGMGSTWLLPEIAGAAVARDLLLTGRPVSGPELQLTNLVTRLIDAGTFADEVAASAAALARSAPLARDSILHAVRSAAGPALAAALESEATAQARTLVSGDVREARAARSERRPPEFGGV